MPRGARLDTPGALHHVMARGIENRRIFRDGRDYDDFIGRVSALVQAKALTVYAWALLPNHFHLLVRTGARPLARSMRSLLTGYAGAFNRRHHRRGHLFQNRYKSIVVEEEPYFLELVRYLHLNPIRAGVLRDLRALDRYAYAGHSAIVGMTTHPWQATGEVLGRFAERSKEARKRYQAFVAEGLSQGHRPELQGGGLVRSAGGWAAVEALRRGREAHTADERVLGSGEFVDTLLHEVERQAKQREMAARRQVSLQVLAGRIGESMSLSASLLLGKTRAKAAVQARQILAYVWVERLGRRASDLASELGQTRGNISLAAKRGAEFAKSWGDSIPRWCR